MENKTICPDEIVSSRRISRRIAVFIFFFIGLLQSVFAFAMFNRPVDHYYFLEIANRGIKFANPAIIPIYELKAQVAGIVFYWICAPSRILGGSELIHILWLRILTLWGFLLAYQWVRKILKNNKPIQKLDNSYIYFMLICLLYPGQLAWTASLLRDGISCTALFGALHCFSYGRRIIGSLCVLLCLALRPEFTLLVGLLMIPDSYYKIFIRRRFRISLLIVLCALFSMLTFFPRSIQSDFAEAAFGMDGLAYPPIAGIFDLTGYLLVVAQGILDPVPLQNLYSVGLFHILEILFFCLIIIASLMLLRQSNLVTAKLLIVNLVVMWAFAYFEIFVSGFSRHRLALVVILIALISQRRMTGRIQTGLGANSLPTV